MSPVSRTFFAATLVLAGATGTASAMPETLSCASATSLNWQSDPPVLLAASSEEFAGPIVHLDPSSGEWYLEVPGSAALTHGGGTFDILRPSEFAAYWHEWVGAQEDTMLRISGGGDAPFRFVFVGPKQGVLAGSCIEPAEPFVFLRSGS